jgi:hypothetical protein
MNSLIIFLFVVQNITAYNQCSEVRAPSTCVQVFEERVGPALRLERARIAVRVAITLEHEIILAQVVPLSQMENTKIGHLSQDVLLIISYYVRSQGSQNLP